LAVDDRSTEDSALVLAVAQALTHDVDSRKACLRVNSRLGAIHLSGDLPSAAARDLASTTALAVPGVTSVHNAATLPRAHPNEDAGSIVPA
jgi:osmotically-inducible protein OsmY